MNTDAFKIAQAVGQNLGGYQQQSNDLASMGEILREAQTSEDPQALDNAMNRMLSQIRDPNRRAAGVGVLQKRAEGIQKGITEENKLKEAELKKEDIGEQEFKKERSKAVSKFVNTTIENSEKANEMQFSIDTAERAIKGEIQGPGLKAAAKKSPFGQLIMGLTPDESELQAANKKLLQGTKGLFGPKPTEREIFLLLNEMLPSIGKTQEANQKGIDFIRKINDMALTKGDITNQLTENGTKYVPDLEFQVQNQMKPHIQDLLDKLRNASGEDAANEVLNKEDSNAVIIIDLEGKRRVIPKEMEEEALLKGAKLA